MSLSLLLFLDEVEFEVTTDTNKGKLIARRVVCLPPGSVSFETLGEERCLGKVDQEPLLVRNYSAFGGRRTSTSQDETDLGIGRIVYETKGVREGVSGFVVLIMLFRNVSLSLMDSLTSMMTEIYILEMKSHFIWQKIRGLLLLFNYY